MADRKTYQSSDHMQNGGGLQPGQDFESLYTTKPDSIGSSGDTSPNSHERDREHTRGA